MVVIGVTGGLGSGKSTVAQMFKDLGAAVVDADKIVHDLLKPGRPCFKPVVKLLGEKVLTCGRIDRAKIAELVFEAPRKLKSLEKAIHPRAVREMRSRIRAYKKTKRVKAVVMDVPLLFEAGLEGMVDLIVVVSSTKDQQIRRSMKRQGLKRAQVLNRIKAQMPLKEKTLLADSIIVNRGTRQRTREQVKIIWNKLIINS